MTIIQLITFIFYITRITTTIENRALEKNFNEKVNITKDEFFELEVDLSILFERIDILINYKAIRLFEELEFKFQSIKKQFDNYISNLKKAHFMTNNEKRKLNFEIYKILKIIIIIIAEKQQNNILPIENNLISGTKNKAQHEKERELYINILQKLINQMMKRVDNLEGETENLKAFQEEINKQINDYEQIIFKNTDSAKNFGHLEVLKKKANVYFSSFETDQKRTLWQSDRDEFQRKTIVAILETKIALKKAIIHWEDIGIYIRPDDIESMKKILRRIEKSCFFKNE
ncbi:hypothetical protein EDEG_04083 [Edhazardia aedis USNM 41457]|uniref:Uncharacterized protein n=1 Tax=Edhazardia aedis (strain USNM 41457) TaxID=1003232 RepID=J9DCT4_EDHAE|nr:hypothetical protein EDEG_04083 [Edhazardia aedis USNM 41457]|eukprot:EJW05279.1 hypothetical protein EDEG_04083 [Edhazardia aedis USNM 41457]